MSLYEQHDRLTPETYLARHREEVSLEVDPSDLDDVTLIVLACERLCHSYNPAGQYIRSINARLIRAVAGVRVPHHSLELWAQKYRLDFEYHLSLRSHDHLEDGPSLFEDRPNVSILSDYVFCSLCVRSVHTSKRFVPSALSNMEEETIAQLASILRTDRLSSRLAESFTKDELLMEGDIRHRAAQRNLH